MANLFNPPNNTTSADFATALDRPELTSQDTVAILRGDLVPANAAATQIMPVDQKNRKCTITNRSTTNKIKVSIEAILVTYAALTEDYVLFEIVPGGTAVIENPEVRMGVWAISDAAVPAGCPATAMKSKLN
jgi:hypothetical protein